MNLAVTPQHLSDLPAPATDPFFAGVKEDPLHCEAPECGCTIMPGMDYFMVSDMEDSTDTDSWPVCSKECAERMIEWIHKKWPE